MSVTYQIVGTWLATREKTAKLFLTQTLAEERRRVGGSERGREKEGGRERGREREGGREKEGGRERERERGGEGERGREREREGEGGRKRGRVLLLIVCSLWDYRGVTYNNAVLSSNCLYKTRWERGRERGRERERERETGMWKGDTQYTILLNTK